MFAVRVVAILAAGLASGCGRAAEPVDAFLAAIATHCGRAFAGRVVANDPKPANDAL